MEAVLVRHTVKFTMGFLGWGHYVWFGHFGPLKKSETSTLWGYWVNDDTIFLLSRSDTISLKSGIDGKINLYRTLCAATSYTYITHSEIEIWDKTRPSIPLFEEMVSLLLTRKIVSSFTHWPRMPMTSKSSTRLRFFFLLRVAKTIRTLFYLCQTLIKTILFMRWNVNKL